VQHPPSPPTTGRLAPTPSGMLHLGNAVAFAAAWLSVRQRGGELLLRFEDVDRSRARREMESAQRRDLHWLGLTWDREVRRQSERNYEPWLAALDSYTYRCTCSRKSVRLSGGVYQGVCRDAAHDEGAVRFRLPAALSSFTDRVYGPTHVDISAMSDPILRRSDGEFAYALAVVADDIADGVTEVVRGADLLDLSAVQTEVWRAFGATPPTWLHTPLVLGADGRKLSKSNGSSNIGALRDSGWTASDVWRQVLPWLGVQGHDDLVSAVDSFEPTRCAAVAIRLVDEEMPDSSVGFGVERRPKTASEG
jgi:glutamyl-Q tRNA(Asp) synthetase